MKGFSASNHVLKAGCAGLAALVAVVLALCSPVARPVAHASSVNDAGDAVVTTQSGVGLASAKASAIGKTVKKDAKAIVKAAKAAKGTPSERLDKIYAYIATDKQWGGAFSFPSDAYLYFYFKATSKADKAYYPISQPENLKDFYKKYAIDAYKTKQASCHHYAALFAVAASQALGSDAKVQVATRNVLKKGVRDVHSWVEVTLGKTTYIYDTQKGNAYSKEQGVKDDFGKYCGSEKSSMKSSYNKFKGVKYATVKL